MRLSVLCVQLLDLLHKVYPKAISITLILQQLNEHAKAEVNKALYKMQSEMLVCRSPTNPPQWALLPHGLQHTKPIYCHTAVPSVGRSTYNKLEAKDSSVTVGSTIHDPKGNAISIVNEYAQSKQLEVKFDVSTTGPPHNLCFSTTFTIGEQVFPAATGRNKKESKLRSAEFVLRELKLDKPIGPMFMDSSLHDRITNLAHQCCSDLVDRTLVLGRLIFAAVIMSQPILDQPIKWKVVSFGTGNRCVSGDELSMTGHTVHDSHAEVVARRSLLLYIYKQIKDYHSQPNHHENIFEMATNSRLRIKLGVKFHLFVSIAPCGDASIFPTCDITMPNDDAHHPLFENNKQGLLRSKVEKGEGCIPVGEDTRTTWDGVARGGRLRIMSCSDKIAKWNLLGFQGSLLTQLIDPVYFDSITLGRLYHPGHATRAFCCRVERALGDYPCGGVLGEFTMHHPKIGRHSRVEPGRETGKLKSREFSLNWSLDGGRAEITDGTRGRSGVTSRICKSNLYGLFKQLSDVKYRSYREAKLASCGYQRAKHHMVGSLSKAGYGMWAGLPDEVDEFV